eukprot:CAMPEP_0118688346 /NCGR_PEP_ID=MMETSP0800-20121206/8869_1 /TAXON_ID=210618 ORGANISM="Striatella unipunctata, Strain CCMP2910" /NCGR_SAMPLE_ID=MMETSP0800 /ASSEMBLY_ACC=CAM_ASM_000638 /LENGTH=292 /DNA_ID=CAMNT_0006585595 /DNA_START=110 /DNA_END=988 /DNA_ORIENTATION=+
MPSTRTIDKILPRPRRHWVGDGFHVYPVFDRFAFTNTVSPLLMFDYAAPKEFPARKHKQPLGVGQHPHRGFETVTIAFQGEVEHHDSTGNSGIIKSGDVQWMTAGRGIIHQEYHSKEFTERGGTFEMCQLWVNLPKKNKMTKPRYQEIVSSSIPTVKLADDASVRIISGDFEEIKGPAKTFSPVNLWDISLPKKGSKVSIPYPSDQACIVFVRRGSVNTDSKILGPQDVAITKIDGESDVLELIVLEDNSSILLMGGEPLNEPIANRGPFVMNTQQELQQAMIDFRTGKMGR